MQTAERQRLVASLSHEPAYALGTVLKCGIGVAFLALLTVIGSTQENAPAAQGAPQEALRATSAAGTPDAAAHRKELFDERRARFMSKASGRERGELSLAPRNE